MTNFVKAKLAFHHDSVGSKAHNEVFEVKNAETLQQLEQMGYVEKVDGQEFQEQQKLQKEVGKANALTNEAVSMAHHVQNQQANQHQQTIAEARQQALKQVAQQNQHSQNTRTTAVNANAKKATDK